MYTELYHHGILGQRWGIRRYQYSDGRYTLAGRVRYGIGSSEETMSRTLSTPIRAASKWIAQKYDAIKRIDKYINANVEFSRIQVDREVTPYAFYATYKKHDRELYEGLFGANLRSRANAAARAAEKLAKKVSATDEQKLDAKSKREYADNLRVYQVKFGLKGKLKVPSDRNAEDVVGELLRGQDFKADLTKSLANARTAMRRPKQQALLSDAQSILRNRSGDLSRKDLATMYKALNLSLTFHNDYDNRVQDTFYGALKKRGYSAIVDLNDQKYSSYHAKKPMIVIDPNSVFVKSFDQLSQQRMDKLYVKYNRERMIKEIPTQILTAIPNYGRATMNDAKSYVRSTIDNYLNT